MRFAPGAAALVLLSVCLGIHAADPAPSAAPRIVDGTLQPVSSFPSVGVIDDNAHTFSCTGTLIDATHVLTAAHCSVDETTNLPLAGNGLEFILGGTTYHTTKIFVHPTFNANAIGSDGVIDVSILQLDMPVQGVTPSPINRTPPALGTAVTLAGYGLLGTDKSALKKQPPPGQIGVGTNTIDTVTATTIDWTFTPGSSSLSPGDSGGPAFINVNGQMAIAGITSLGETSAGNKIKCGARNFDTRIDTLAGWIDSVLTGTIAALPPQVTSPITVSPNPAATTDTIGFTVAATDPNSTNLFFIWDFGDGSAGTGPATTHNYPFPGNYTVTVTVSDFVIGITSNANVTVNPAGVGTLSIDKLQLAFNFASTGKDSFQFQGHVNPAPNIAGLPIAGILGIGDVQTPFVLDPRGRGKVPGGTVMLNMQKGTFTASVRNGDFSALLAKDGIVNADVPSVRVVIPVMLVLNGVAYSKNATLTYTAKQDRSGKAK